MKDLKLEIPKDCDNAPRKAFLKEFNIAFAKADIDFIMSHISDQITWNIYGDQQLTGRADFENAVRRMTEHQAEGLILHHLVTHGREAAVNGVMIMEGGKEYAFCDVYEFTSTTKNRIKRIDSYVLPSGF